MAKAASSSLGHRRLRAAADTHGYKSKPPGHPADTGHLQTGPTAIEAVIAPECGETKMATSCPIGFDPKRLREQGLETFVAHDIDPTCAPA